MAVHTVLKENEIKRILSLYDVGNLIEYKGITQGIENTNYFLKTNKEKYILTIFEKRVNNRDLPFYLDLMDHIKSQGINCPRSLLSKQKKRLQSIKKKKLAIFTFIHGKCLKNWNKDICYSVGKELAKLHQLSTNFHKERNNDFSINKWVSIFEKLKKKVGNFFPETDSIISKELDFLKENWLKNLPKGIIHADLFPDNILFKNNKISGIIDFYFSCTDFFVYDLAITINAWCFNKNKFQHSFFSSLINGYQSERKLTEHEKKKLNISLRGAAIRFLLTRLLDFYKEEKNLIKKDPLDFLNILSFHTRNDLKC